MKMEEDFETLITSFIKNKVGISEHFLRPTQGKAVFFKSNELEHEVLLTNQTRISITGWLKGR